MHFVVKMQSCLYVTVGGIYSYHCTIKGQTATSLKLDLRGVGHPTLLRNLYRP